MKLRYLNALRMLEAALRRGSFAAAAEELGVSPAAVGQQIRHLEEAFGMPLFDRAPGGARPTAAAERARLSLTQGFALLADSYRALEAAQPSNRLALSSTFGFAEHLLPAILPAFLASRRDVDFSIEATPRQVDLFQGEIDFAVRHCPKPDDRYEAAQLYPEYIMPVCAPSFAERYRLCPGTTDLTGVPLGYSQVPTTDPDFRDWPGWSQVTGVAIEEDVGRQRFSGYGSNFRFAQAGLCLALGNPVHLFPLIQSGALIAPLGPDRILRSRWSFWLVRVKAMTATPVQRAFRDWLTDEINAIREALEPQLGAERTQAGWHS